MLAHSRLSVVNLQPRNYFIFCTVSISSIYMVPWAIAKAKETVLLSQNCAGPEKTTIVQVTPTVTQPPGTDKLFQDALLNIFSASLKPLDVAAFLRGIKLRFKVHRFVARAQGSQGLFQADMPETLSLHALDEGGESVHSPLQLVHLQVAVIA
jgi:hypothetical protein